MTGVDVGFDLSTGELLLAAIDPGDFVGYVALGILVGFLSGLFGVGGGFLLTPLLNVLFGLPYNLAVGSSLVQITVASWVGTRQHIRLGHVDHRLGFALLTGSFLGAETGVRMQASLRAIGDIEVGGKVLSGFDLSMAFLFIVLLTCLGWAMLVETRRSLLRTSAHRLSTAVYTIARIGKRRRPKRASPRPISPAHTISITNQGLRLRRSRNLLAWPNGSTQ